MIAGFHGDKSDQTNADSALQWIKMVPFDYDVGDQSTVSNREATNTYHHEDNPRKLTEGSPKWFVYQLLHMMWLSLHEPAPYDSPHVYFSHYIYIHTHTRLERTHATREINAKHRVNICSLEQLGRRSCCHHKGFTFPINRTSGFARDVAFVWVRIVGTWVRSGVNYARVNEPRLV